MCKMKIIYDYNHNHLYCQINTILIRQYMKTNEQIYLTINIYNDLRRTNRQITKIKGNKFDKNYISEKNCEKTVKCLDDHVIHLCLN